MEDYEKRFQEFVEVARKDPNIIGFFLNGSRGKNRETKYSDYDAEVIVKDGLSKEYQEKYWKHEKESKGMFGFGVQSISEFRTYAAMGSEFEWQRPSYTHIKAIIDKTGEVQKLIDEKSRIPEDKIHEYIAEKADAYINYLYRSIKCFRDGEYVGARLEASRSVPYLLDTVFGLEGRTTPYYKYLEWELKKYPLKKLDMEPKELTDTLLKIISDGDVETQRKLFLNVEKILKREGYSELLASWEPDGSMKTIKGYKK